MAAMHEDSSPELTEVAWILEDILEVDMKAIFFPLLSLFVYCNWNEPGICVITMTSLILFSWSVLLSSQITDIPLKVRKLVAKICDIVTRRAARLAAAGIVGILKKIGRDGTSGIAGGRSRTNIKLKRTVVAIEGGLYTSYTMFREYLHEALVEILGEEIALHVILKPTEDGSGIGAALLAASYSAYDTVSVDNSL